jgi:hypothetical protein
LAINYLVFIRDYSWNHFYLPNIDQDNAWMYWYKYIYYPTYNRLDGLLIGVSIAGLYRFLPTVFNKVAKYGNLLLLLGFLVLNEAYILCYEERSYYYASVFFGFPLVAIAYGFILMSAISLPVFYINGIRKLQHALQHYPTLFILRIKV